MQKIRPCLWFNGRVEEALEFYTSIFKNASVEEISYYTGGPMDGQILTATFDLEGQEFMILNGGPNFKHSEAISFLINCKDQEEIDYYWNKLTADGGRESMCGWLEDKFGISWQVAPAEINELINSGESNAGRIMEELTKMKKIDLAVLRNAAWEK